ncbi:sugar ABC transporter permease [uncultured Faecalibaculum sp.]|uniref:sugar ABC transporter permease n=1 Tax=uncultured Faecalibaculum sp. TaxID=1729681 RepID=UPI0025D6A8E0|nr:ABC transporter permease subunit [uncultured Faecalibaculum sp.]
MNATVKKRVSNTLTYIGLSILAIIWVFPIVWVVLYSFSAQKGSYISTILPKAWTISNYTKLFTDTSILNFPRMFTNTLIIAICSCLLSVFFTISVAYCMSRLRFKLRKPFMNIAMILGLFPGFMAMVAVYFILQSFGLTEGSMIKVALILVYSAGAGVKFYVAKGFFDTMPKALDEAAEMDGCTKWQIFTKITMPLSKPIIISTTLQAFMAPWIDFIFAKVICRANANEYTVAIGMWQMLDKTYINDWYMRFLAAAVLISIPIAIIFIFMQKFYADGMGGAVKG